MRRKEILRTCIVSRKQFPKNELLRIVRSKDGVLSIDETGKMNGRGAYIERTTEAVQQAMKTKALERSFKTSIPQDFYEELLAYFEK